MRLCLEKLKLLPASQHCYKVVKWAGHWESTVETAMSEQMDRNTATQECNQMPRPILSTHKGTAQ